MIDLKISKKEKKRMEEGKMPSSYDYPDYPWGTRINLETEQIKKLGLKSLNAGDIVAISGMGKVIQVNIEDNDKSDKTTRMEIQIQKIDIMSEEDSMKKMRNEVANEVFSESAR